MVWLTVYVPLGSRTALYPAWAADVKAALIQELTSTDPSARQLAGHAGVPAAYVAEQNTRVRNRGKENRGKLAYQRVQLSVQGSI